MAPYRLYVYGAIALALVIGLAYYRHTLIMEGEAKVIAADKVAVERQKEAVAEAEKIWAIRLQNARTEHDAEIALAPVAIRHVLRCDPRGSGAVPGPESVPGGVGASPAVVQQDAGLHPDDIGPALYLLAERADKLAADARELNSLTH